MPSTNFENNYLHLTQIMGENTGKIQTKVNIKWGLIFRGKKPARPMGAYFRGGLLFRVYSNSMVITVISCD